MASFFDTYMQEVTAKKAAEEQAKATPAAQPAQLQELPLQATPTQTAAPKQQQAVAPIAYTPPPLRKLQETETTQGTPEQAANYAKSVAREQNIYAGQESYLGDMSKAQKEASAAADVEMGSAQQKAQQYADAVNFQKDAYEADLKEMDSAIEKLKSTQFKDFWADKGTANKIGTAIAVALGQYASTMTGTQNMAWNILQKAMDDDFRLQQANYDKQLKNIEMLRLGAAQKEKLMDAATKDFEVYKVARASFVEDKINQAMKDRPTPALQEALTKTQLAKEAAYQAGMDKLMQKRVNQVQSAIPQAPINHETATKERDSKESLLYKYNKAQDDYKKILDFKKSGNYNASVIQLVANGLSQGSYNPDNFETTSRSTLQKLKDKGLKELGEGEKQMVVKAAEKYFEESAKSAYSEFKDQLPMYQELSMRTSMQQGQRKPIFNMYAREPAPDILNKTKDLSQSGLKKAQ